MDWQPEQTEAVESANASAAGAAGPAVPAGVTGSSRSKRKMAKQLRFLAKLQKTQQVLSAKKTIGKKRKRSRDTSGKTLNNLSSLAEFLPTFGDKDERPAKRTAKVLRSKARRDIVLGETKQLAAVLSHPSFKANPFSAIQQHLTNTLPPPPAAPSSAEKKPKADKGSSKKKKNKKKSKKVAEGSLAMEE